LILRKISVRFHIKKFSSKTILFEERVHNNYYRHDFTSRLFPSRSCSRCNCSCFSRTIPNFSYLQTLIGGWQPRFARNFRSSAHWPAYHLRILDLTRPITKLFLDIISKIGGICVLYLPQSACRDWHVGSANINNTNSETRFSKGVLKGMFMNFLSVDPYIFWMLVNDPILLSSLRQSLFHAAAFLLGFIGVFIGNLVILVVIFDQTW